MKKKWQYCFLMLTMVAIILLNCFLVVDASETGVMKGGIHILKTDVLGNGLSGAGYQIAREATREELMDTSISKRLLKTKESLLTVVYPSFWDSREMFGGKVSEVVTDAAGKAALYGLPYGTYYLVESRPPQGYDRMTVPIRVTINKYSHLIPEDEIRDDEDTVIDNTVHIVTIRYKMSEMENTVSLQIILSLIVLLLSIGILFRLLRSRKICRT